MAIPAPLQAVIQVFEGPLSGVRFADIDRAAFAALAAEVEARAAEVSAQEANLLTLRAALAQQEEALLALAQRGLAYARVYAENDPELSQQLAAITLPRPAKKARGEGAAAQSKAPSAPREVSPQESATEPAAPAPNRRGKRRVTREEETSLDEAG